MPLLKADYLAQLREALSGQVEEVELEDILNDYSELIDEGISEGKSEQEMCRTLGTPFQTAAFILEDRGFNQTRSVNPPPPASLASRAAAALIDHALAVFPLAFFGLLPVLPLMLLWPPFIFSYSFYSAPPSTGVIVGVWICLAYFILYHPLFLCLFKGQTPGKRLVGIRVVSHNGEQTQNWRFFLREIGRLLLHSFTFGFGGIISFICAAVSSDNRALHDAIANTRVVASPARRRAE
ncbi:DUF1700 domain-containing protein [Paenibacillaceae bacterium]|nr:DUF1700 domain-containing protein [Paenibacillaceae bacterium]